MKLMNGHMRFLIKYSWKLKFLLNMFMLFVNNKVLLTKNNHNWYGCKKCCFCDT